MKYTVRCGKCYRAKIRLGFFQQVASNDAVAAKLTEAGFSDVTVSGSGRDRLAIGRWAHPDATSELPDEIVPPILEFS